MRTPGSAFGLALLTCLSPLVPAVSSQSSPAPAQPPAAALQTAGAAFARSDWKGALEAYSALTTQYPQHPLSRFRTGVALMELGRYKEGEAALREGEKLGVPVPQAAFRLGQLFALAGRPDDAFAELHRSVQARLPLLPLTLASDAHFASLKRDARWARVLDDLDAVAYPCKHDPKAREFDFWVGDWDVWATGSPRPPQPARNVISIEDDGCVLTEHWTSAGGSEGQSFNLWDRSIGEWRQTWVDNSGGQHDYHGGIKDGNMVYTGTVPAANGARGRVPVRLTFFRIAPDTVRQFSELSADSGRTWQTNYDFTYVRRGDARGAPLNVTDLAAIRTLDSTFVQAWLRDDTTAVLNLFAPDAVLMPPGSQPVSGVDAIRAFWWPAVGPPTTITSFERTITEIAGNRDLAYLRATSALAWRSTKAASTSSQRSRSTDLLLLVRNANGVWRVTRQMWSPLP